MFSGSFCSPSTTIECGVLFSCEIIFMSSQNEVGSTRKAPSEKTALRDNRMDFENSQSRNYMSSGIPASLNISLLVQGYVWILSVPCDLQDRTHDDRLDRPPRWWRPWSSFAAIWRAIMVQTAFWVCYFSTPVPETWFTPFGRHP